MLWSARTNDPSEGSNGAAKPTPALRTHTRGALKSYELNYSGIIGWFVGARHSETRAVYRCSGRTLRFELKKLVGS